MLKTTIAKMGGLSNTKVNACDPFQFFLNITAEATGGGYNKDDKESNRLSLVFQWTAPNINGRKWKH